MKLNVTPFWRRSVVLTQTLLIGLLLGPGPEALGQPASDTASLPSTQEAPPPGGANPTTGSATAPAEDRGSDQAASTREVTQGVSAERSGVDIGELPFAWQAEDSSKLQSGISGIEREPGLGLGHLWRGQTAHLKVLQTGVEVSALQVRRVLLVDEPLADAVTAASTATSPSTPGAASPTLPTRAGPCPDIDSPLPAQHAAYLDLSPRSSLSADRRTLSIVLPQDSSFKLLSIPTLDVLKGGRAFGTLCIYYSADTTASSAPSARASKPVMEARVAALPVQVSLRSIAALWGFGGLLITFLLLHWTLVSYWGRGQKTVLGQHQSGLWLPRRVLLSMMSLTLTPTGSFSLSMAQILWWTLITGFGLTYVWAMTEEFLAITTDVLMLMGIGSTTAIISRVTSNNRTFLPDRYLGLVQARERLPRLSDLVTIDGKPSVFKFQMLLFTVLSGIMVLQGLISSCRFPALPAELITLMGISSATYVGNELAQRDIWEQVQEKVKAIEAFARLKHLSLVSRRDVEKLKEQPDIAPAVEELESLLRQVFGDDPAIQAQTFNLPGPAAKSGGPDTAPPAGSQNPPPPADEDHISEGPRHSPA